MNAHRLAACFALLLLSSGCTTYEEYNVSAARPFSEYSGKDVTLARDVDLVVLTIPEKKPD
jgi:hypothetical protein